MQPKESCNLINLIEVDCGYGKKTIVSKVNLTLSSSNRLAIIGDNGQGKSTLLKTMMGILDPLRGERRQNYSNINMAYVPQRSEQEFLMPMRVKDYVALGFVAGKKVPKEEHNDYVKHSLQLVHLDDRENDDVSILSGGQFQRIVLARALVRKPELLYLDEPTAGLDRKSSNQFMEELKIIFNQNGVSYVMVIHDFRLLKDYFSHVIWIEEGQGKFYDIESALKDESFLSFTGLHS